MIGWLRRRAAHRAALRREAERLEDAAVDAFLAAMRASA